MKQQTFAMAADQSESFERYRDRRDATSSCNDGSHRAVGRLVRGDRAVLPQGRQWPPPVGLERMLRMYFVQHWFNLADEACEEALLDSVALRRFVGIDLGRERVPDGTTLLKFRRLLEQHKLGAALFAQVGQVLQDRA